jgi:hypothetical protein
MRVSKLEKAKQIIAALYNLPELPVAGINFERATKLAKETHANLDSQWKLANSILLRRK